MNRVQVGDILISLVDRGDDLVKGKEYKVIKVDDQFFYFSLDGGWCHERIDPEFNTIGYYFELATREKKLMRILNDE